RPWYRGQGSFPGVRTVCAPGRVAQCRDGRQRSGADARQGDCGRPWRRDRARKPARTRPARPPHFAPRAGRRVVLLMLFVAPTPQIAAVVLAAGMSTRMGRNKLLMDIVGESLVRRVVKAVEASRARPIVVVTGQ